MVQDTAEYVLVFTVRATSMVVGQQDLRAVAMSFPGVE